MKICPLGAELLYADGETETDRHDEANSCYSQFCTYNFKRISIFQRAGNCEQWAAHLLCIYNYPSIFFLLDKEPPTQLTQHCYMTEGTQQIKHLVCESQPGTKCTIILLVQLGYITV